MLLPLSARRLAGGAKGKEHAMAEILKSVIRKKEALTRSCVAKISGL